MTLNFNIEYRTNWGGEEIHVCGSVPELGNQQPENSYALHTIDGIHWTGSVDIQQTASPILYYWYQVHCNGRQTRTEWNNLPRSLHVEQADNQQTFQLQDCWKDMPEELCFYTSAFTASLLARKECNSAPTFHKRGILIKAYAPCIGPDHCLAISGNHHLLGDWNPEKAVLMNDIDFPEWQIELNADILQFPLEYKLYYTTLKKDMLNYGKIIPTAIWLFPN